MTQRTEPLPPFLAEPSKIGEEISVTGKWIPAKKGGLFRKSAESKEMLKEWEDIHAGARSDPGVLSTEIDHAVCEEFLTPPIDRGAEIRCYLRDPDGHLIEVGQAAGVLQRD